MWRQQGSSRRGSHRRVRPDAREARSRRCPTGWGRVYAAAVGEDGKIRVFEVWDSREQAEAWGEKVMAVRTEAGFGDGPPSIEYLEVHKLFSASRFGTSRRERLRSLAPTFACASVRGISLERTAPA